MTTASIVTYHTDPEELLTAIRCLVAEGVAPIYIIDNAALKKGVPSHSEIRGVVDAFSEVIYIPSENVGYGAGHNQGIRRAIEAGADYHIVMNSDVYWHGPVVETLTGYMRTHPEVGQMMPKVLNTDGTLQLQCKLIPTPADLLLKRFMPARMKKRRMRRFQLEFTGYDHVMNVPYLSGCFMCFSIAALRECGLFDERFFMYPEDIDITRRMHELRQTLYYPSVCITHKYAAESRRSKRMLRIHIANMVRYFNKWGWIFDSRRRHYNKALLEQEDYRTKQ